VFLSSGCCGIICSAPAFPKHDIHEYLIDRPSFRYTQYDIVYERGNRARAPSQKQFDVTENLCVKNLFIIFFWKGRTEDWLHDLMESESAAENITARQNVEPHRIRDDARVPIALAYAVNLDRNFSDGSEGLKTTRRVLSHKIVVGDFLNDYVPAVDINSRSVIADALIFVERRPYKNRARSSGIPGGAFIRGL
jgi:hypothetical protein